MLDSSKSQAYSASTDFCWIPRMSNWYIHLLLNAIFFWFPWCQNLKETKISEVMLYLLPGCRENVVKSLAFASAELGLTNDLISY